MDKLYQKPGHPCDNLYQPYWSGEKDAKEYKNNNVWTGFIRFSTLVLSNQKRKPVPMRFFPLEIPNVNQFLGNNFQLSYKFLKYFNLFLKNLNSRLKTEPGTLATGLSISERPKDSVLGSNDVYKKEKRNKLMVQRFIKVIFSFDIYYCRVVPLLMCIKWDKYLWYDWLNAHDGFTGKYK